MIDNWGPNGFLVDFDFDGDYSIFDTEELILWKCPGNPSLGENLGEKDKNIKGKIDDLFKELEESL